MPSTETETTTGTPEAALSADAPRRARGSRSDEIQGERRRRRTGSIDMMGQFKLDCPASALDPNYVYRWVNDDGARVFQLSRYDDYDLVSADSIKGAFDEQSAAEESSETVRRIVGRNENGPMYAYLMRKRRDWWQADYDETVRKGEAELSERVLNENDGAVKAEGAPTNAYTPEGNRIGGVRRKQAA